MSKIKVFSTSKLHWLCKGRDTHSDFTVATGDQRLAIKVVVSRPKTLAIFDPSHQSLAFEYVGKLTTFYPAILTSLCVYQG